MLLQVGDDATGTSGSSAKRENMPLGAGVPCVCHHASGLAKNLRRAESEGIAGLVEPCLPHCGWCAHITTTGHGGPVSPRLVMVGLYHHDWSWCACITTTGHGVPVSPRLAMVGLYHHDWPWWACVTTTGHGGPVSPRLVMVCLYHHDWPWWACITTSWSWCACITTSWPWWACVTTAGHSVPVCHHS